MVAKRATRRDRNRWHQEPGYRDGWWSARLLVVALGVAACEGRTGLPTPSETRPCPGKSFDCDGNAENGCESDLANDPKSCGACRKHCEDGLSCADGVCVPGNTLVQIDSMISTQFVRTADGRVLVWGNNEYGKANPDSQEKFIVSPELLSLPEPSVEIKTSSLAACSRSLSGNVWCWGDDEDFPAPKGQPPHSYVKVPGLTDARSLMASELGSCVFDAYRQGLCWSGNNWDEISTGAGKTVQFPLHAAVEMKAVHGNLVTLLPALAAVDHGPILVWGDRYFVGYPTTDGSHLRTLSPVPGLSSAIRVEGGRQSYCAMLDDGEVYCWGQIFLADTTVEPRLAFQNGPYKKVAVSGYLCALKESGHVECWLERENDAELDDIRDISGSASTLCLLTSAQKLLCKGSNTEGELGNGVLGGPPSYGISEVSLPPLP